MSHIQHAQKRMREEGITKEQWLADVRKKFEEKEEE
jgi:hypothetical protein